MENETVSNISILCREDRIEIELNVLNFSGNGCFRYLVVKMKNKHRAVYNSNISGRVYMRKIYKDEDGDGLSSG